MSYGRLLRHQADIPSIDDDAEQAVIRHSSIISHPVISIDSLSFDQLKVLPKAPSIDRSPGDIKVTTPLTAHKASPFRSTANKVRLNQSIIDEQITRPPALNKKIPIIGNVSDSDDEEDSDHISSPQRPPRQQRRLKSKVGRRLACISTNAAPQQ